MTADTMVTDKNKRKVGTKKTKTQKKNHWEMLVLHRTKRKASTEGDVRGRGSQNNQCFKSQGKHTFFRMWSISFKNVVRDRKMWIEKD